MQNEIRTGINHFTIDISVLNSNKMFNYKGFINYILNKTKLKVIQEEEIKYIFVYKDIILLRLYISNQVSSYSQKEKCSLNYYIDFFNLKTYNKDIDNTSDNLVKCCLSYLNINKIYFNIKKLVLFNDVKTNNKNNVLGVETNDKNKSSFYYRENGDYYNPDVIDLPHYCTLFKHKYKKSITRFNIVLNSNLNPRPNDNCLFNYLGIELFLLRYSILLFKDENDLLDFIESYNNNIKIKHHPCNVKIDIKNVISFLSTIYNITVNDRDMLIYDEIKRDPISGLNI